MGQWDGSSTATGAPAREKLRGTSAAPGLPGLMQHAKRFDAAPFDQHSGFSTDELLIASTPCHRSFLGHRNIQHTVCYTVLAPDRFKNFWGDYVLGSAADAVKKRKSVKVQKRNFEWDTMRF